MSKFTVGIEEHYVRFFEVEAKDDVEAEKIATEKYCNGEFKVLDTDGEANDIPEPSCKLMSVDDGEWKEVYEAY